jgi:glycosyltransferase involved in cell wall biosynthesis
MKTDTPTVIIPAHNEEAVIERTLTVLLRDAAIKEFEVIVVCNGCQDSTAEIVRSSFSEITVIELEKASKTAAINAGLKKVRGQSVLLLDADIELDTTSARLLFRAVKEPGIEAAIGHMAIDTNGADALVRAFYRVWLHHPYLLHGKFAAAIALSREGLRRVGMLREVIADDTYLRRLIPANRVKLLASVSFRVRVPRTLKALIQVRSRSYKGNRQLARQMASTQETYTGEALGLIRRIAGRPSLWLSAFVYFAVTLAARYRSHQEHGVRWERDLTTRSRLAE